MYIFRNIEEILAEKGETVKRLTVNADIAIEKAAQITASNIELVLDEKTSNIFQTTSVIVKSKNEN